MPALLYDTGALVAAERRHPMIWRLHDRANAAGIVPVVPVVVLARAWRGGPQHNLSRLLRGCRILPDDEMAGRAAGRACAAAGTSDVVDALVVVTATQLAAPVVTSDPDDLAHLASSLGATLVVHSL
ncbi:MAG: PIN domain-containing protein [Gammaproteobacteria bacterium]